MKKIQGKIAGALLGLATGGPIGAAFGLIIGHIYDRRVYGLNGPEPENWSNFTQSYGPFVGTPQQTIFTVGVIVLGAKMAKADGRVTRQEINAFKRVFNVTPQQEDQVGKLFNRARTSVAGFEPYAFQLSHAFRGNPAVLEEILGGLFIIGAADSSGLSPAEIEFLKRVAVIFDFSMEDFARIAARAGVVLPQEYRPRDTMAEAYEILGVRVEATADQIKLAYRALVREHHPDRLVAQGMPSEFVATANEKVKRINGAYDAICRARGIK